jgi:hypothetical protein
MSKRTETLPCPIQFNVPRGEHEGLKRVKRETGTPASMQYRLAWREKYAKKEGER